MAFGDDEFLTTKELANLLRVKERKVYELVSEGEVPCTRAMGKLLFPRVAIQEWLAANGSGYSAAASKPRPAVVLGSHDPLLDWALRESQCGLATFFDGSMDGIERYAEGGGIASGLHVYNAADKSWNVGLIKNRFGGKPVVLLQWIWRERGLMLKPEMAGGIKGLADIKTLTLVPRQAEAGSQRLLEHLLEEAKIPLADLKLAPVARTETDAAVAVYDGTAEVAFGIESLARQYKLAFVPVMRERYDILVDRRSWFEPSWQTFLKFCRSDAFKKRAAEQPGYDTDGMGDILFNGAS